MVDTTISWTRYSDGKVKLTRKIMEWTFMCDDVFILFVEKCLSDPLDVEIILMSVIIGGTSIEDWDPQT
jgi:hypothetical protein